MSGRARQLYEYAHRLEQIKVDMVQMKLDEVGRLLEPGIDILRKQAELELMDYQRKYGERV